MRADNPTRKNDVHARKLGKEWLLYDTENERLHVINATAEFVWRLCDGAHDLAAVKAELRAQYDIKDEEKLDAELNTILADFDRIGVLQGS
jgi:hypothetical protein